MDSSLRHGRCHQQLPAISADELTIYVGSYDNKLHAINALDGTARWAAPTPRAVLSHSSPAISADRLTIYVGSYDNKLHAIKASDGTSRWGSSRRHGGDIPSSPAISADGQMIYVGSRDNKLHAIKILARACYMASFTTPLHGANGTCAGLSTLNASETCMPSCDSNFVALGVVKCDGDTGMLITIVPLREARALARVWAERAAAGEGDWGKGVGCNR